MRALISGGCGFVGKAFARRFLAEQHAVTTVDDLSASSYDVKQRGSFCRADIRDWVRENDLRDFDLIVHCAAVVGGRLKIDGDPLAVATDLAIDATLFNALAQCKPPRPKLIYFSSSAIYPIEFQTRGSHFQLTESLTTFNTTRWGVPDQTYGFAKLAGEFLAKQAVEKYGIDVLCYRPFSGYGPGQSLDYPFPSLVKRVLDGEDPVTIWGSGDQTRDFIHIDDVVEAVMQTKDKLPPGGTLNLGTGKPTSFKQLVKNIAIPLFGRCPKIVTDETKPEGVFWRVADPYKLHMFYKPKISLGEGILRAVEAYKLDKAKQPA